MKETQLILKRVFSGDIVEGESYLLVRQDIFEQNRECVLALWNGKGWVQDVGSDLEHDWPDAVFENPAKGELTMGKGG